MNKLIFSTALAGLAAAASTAAHAQQLPPAVVAVVNVEQIASTCTACVAATTQLQTQGQALQQRTQALSQQIDAEARALQPLAAAIPAGGQPDAALAARIQAFQTMQQNAEREIGASRERLQRNAQFVDQQISQRIRPAVTTVMQQRGATVVVDRRVLIDASPTLDISAAVLAIVNQNNAAINVNAPAPAAQQPAAATPAAQRPATPQPNRPRPQGR